MQFPDFPGNRIKQMKLNLMAIGVALIAFLVGGCLTKESDQTNRGSEVENEVRVGQIFLADGSPAIDAEVRFYSVDHVPEVPIRKAGGRTYNAAAMAGVAFSTHTDNKGRYKVDTLLAGEYNVLGELNGAFSYQDSVFISASSGKLANDTLRTPGSLTGIVGLQPNHDPVTVTVQIMGTNVFVNVGEAGVFTLSGLAQGHYTGRAITTTAEYTPLYFPISIKTGFADTLKDTLWLPFTGIPVVTGIKAEYDTLVGAAKLSWNKTKYRSFQAYEIYRRPFGALTSDNILVGKTEDTTFADTLYGGNILADTSIPDMEYRIRLLSKSDLEGLNYGSIKVKALSPELVRTRLNLFTLSNSQDSVRIGDTVEVGLEYSNPTRKVRRIEWYVEGVKKPVQVKLDSSGSGKDTLRYAWSTETNPAISVIATDDGNDRNEAQLTIQVINDPPVVDVGLDTNIAAGDKFALSGKVSFLLNSPKERIVKWEWDIGSTGNFIQVSNGDTVLQAPMEMGSELVCELRVTSDRGDVGLASKKITIVPYAILPKMPRSLSSNNSLESVDGKLFVLSAHYSDFVQYDPTQRQWSNKKPFPYVQNSGEAMASLNRKVYALVDSNPGGCTIPYSLHKTRLMEYDPTSNSWRTMSPLPRMRSAAHLVAMRGKLVAFGGFWLSGKREPG